MLNYLPASSAKAEVDDTYIVFLVLKPREDIQRSILRRLILSMIALFLRFFSERTLFLRT